MTDEQVDLDAVWRALVGAALLGTDRRRPPIPDRGPVGDLVADAALPDDAARMLAAVAAVAAARRAAFVPGPPVPSLQPPPPDDRPFCPDAAVATWREVIVEWPVLEDEWVLTVIERGYRLAPDALAELLLRHRRDGVRRARVALAAGPAASWLSDHLSVLAPGIGGTIDADAVLSLPVLPVPPELADLLTADAHTVSNRFAADLAAGRFGAAHKAVLVNVVARCRPAVLLDAADALAATGTGLALALADLARLRHRMLAALGASI